MSDSIQDKLLKEHELSMEELEQVTGGEKEGFQRPPKAHPFDQQIKCSRDCGGETAGSCPYVSCPHDYK